MTKLLNQLTFIGLMLSTVLLFQGCSNDDDDNPNPVDTPIKTGYVISTVSGAWPDFTTYIQ